jgi:aminoglycoside phosphotransferase (APT) family kinase protein
MPNFVSAAPPVPGIDVERVTAWLTAASSSPLTPPLTFTRIGAGQSNLTFRVEDTAGTTFVLRRPPLGAILDSAHDVLREHRILTGLARAGSPVPTPLAACDDPTVTGAPFYTMAHVDGIVPTRVEDVERLSLEARAAVSPSIAATLAGLHAVDLEEVGLGDMRRTESLASRQLRRWQRQWEASKTRPLAIVDEVAELLAARAPDETEQVLLHGDYHLHNVMLGEDGGVRAVLDWELCSVGDPLADVGQMIAYWGELGEVAGRPDSLFRYPITSVEGISGPETLLDAYAAASGRDLGLVDYWIAFGYWKIAIIVEGVYRRWLNDPANGSGAGTLQPAVERLATNAVRLLH